MPKLLSTAPRRQVVTAQLRLNALETFILGAVLASVQGVILNVSMSTHARDALTAVIILLSAVVRPITGEQFVAKLPSEVVILIQAGLGAILILIHSWDLSSVVMTIIAVVLVIANTLGLGPTPASSPVGAKAAKR